jgi:uncharacterized protein YjeT (DUF2065 family)
MMNKLGVALVVLGIVAVLVGLFPGLAGEKEPADGFGTQQQVAVAIGAVLAVIGLVLACKCRKKSCCAAKPDADNSDASAGPTTG